MKLTDHEQGTLSRRSFLRGKLPSTEARLSATWLLADGFSGRADDVLWTTWADDTGLFIAGDDGVILHHDDQGWTRQHAPVPVPIHGLWGTQRHNLWAVGWMGLVLHHDASGWRQVRGCVQDDEGKYAACDENAPLFAISGRADGLAWAVGDHGTILHYDGTAWQAESSGAREHLRAVSCLADGRVVVAGGDGCILVRDTSGNWQRPDYGGSTNFTTALALEDSTVLLAGGRYFIAENGFRGELFLLSDTGLEPVYPGVRFSRFRSLIQAGSSVFTVGDGGQIYRLNGNQMDRLVSNTTHDLLGALALPDGRVVAVGDFGITLFCQNPENTPVVQSSSSVGQSSPWQAMDSGTDRQLWGLWTHPISGQVYSCGEEGVVLVHDRGQWERLPAPADMGIHSLGLAPDGGLLAAGQLGQIHHFDGSVWRQDFDLYMDITLLSLWTDESGNALAAGDEGLVLQRHEDGKWRRMPSGTKSALYGLWGTDAQHILAVGDFGLVLRWNGTRWDEFNAGTEHFLFGVWGRALDDIYVVGLSGTIGHFDGRRWIISPVRARSDLLSVVGTGTDVITVGAAGVVFRHDGQNWVQEESGTAAGLRSVVVGPDGNYIAAGDGGTILVRNR